MQQNAESPMEEKDIPANSDNKIDQDFPGFPGGEAAKKLITPTTEEEKKVAAVNIKDGEKVNKKPADKETDESDSDGSGGAFDSTEDMRDNGDDDSNSRAGK